MTPEVVRLREALQPFAALARAFATARPEARVVSTALGDLTVEDLRRAAEVLK